MWKGLPEDWQLTELGKVCKLPDRQVRPSDFSKYDCYVGLEDIEGSTGRIIKYQKVGEKNLKSSKFFFDESCILYGKLRPYLNKVALPQYVGICSTDILPLRPITEVALREYLYFFLKTPHFVKIATGKSTGANLPRIAPESLLSIAIPLPPIETQRKICQILLRADRLRQSREETNQLTSKVIQSVFLKMFGDPAENPFKYPVFSLGSLANMSRYGPRFYNQPYSEVGIPILRTTDITENGELSLDKAPKLKVSPDDLQKYRLHSGDVVISRSGSLGRCAVYDIGDVDCIPGAFLLHFRFGDKVLPEYVQYFILSESIQKRIQRMGKVVAQPNVNMKELGKLEVPVPSIPNQRRFVEAKSKYHQLRQRQNESFEEISEFFQSLMHKAFRGELRIGTNDSKDIRISKPVNVETEVQSTLANYMSDS